MKQRTNPTEKVLVVGINIGEQTNLLEKMIPIGEQKNLKKMIPLQQISCVGGRAINREPKAEIFITTTTTDHGADHKMCMQTSYQRASRDVGDDRGTDGDDGR